VDIGYTVIFSNASAFGLVGQEQLLHPMAQGVWKEGDRRIVWSKRLVGLYNFLRCRHGIEDIRQPGWRDFALSLMSALL
jgi:hypothetical protein